MHWGAGDGHGSKGQFQKQMTGPKRSRAVAATAGTLNSM